MHFQQLMLGLIVLVGGGAVIASYVHGFLTHPAVRGSLWGGVPVNLKPFYFMSMLLAAAGFFAFTYFILFRLDPDQAQIAGCFDFRLFHVLYLFVLVPSALWMPLTFAMLNHPSSSLWLAIRLNLTVVALASLGLLGALIGLHSREPQLAYWLAVGGSAAFCVQTALLDALVWPAFFRL